VATTQTDLQVKFIEQYIKPVTDDARLRQAFLTTPRTLFVPKQYRSQAYQDHAIPLDHNQSISQPSLVALMIDLCQLKSEHKVLEIGTGSGYQTALLSKLVRAVYSIEIHPKLAASAQRKLHSLKILNAHVIVGNGQLGYYVQAPYDAIIVTASGKKLPPALVAQLVPNGLIVFPLKHDDNNEYLYRGIKKNGLKLQLIEPVRFVPLINSKKRLT